jgi:hypothetical protein
VRRAVVLADPTDTMQLIIVLTLVAVVRGERFLRWDIAVELCLTVAVNETYHLHRHAGPVLGWFQPNL